MRLVIATPSPFARKARIALLEKRLPHEIAVENPWQQTITANPLGKVPVLFLDDGATVPPVLIPQEWRVAHKQVEAIADGICDAVVLIVAERSRPAEKQSGDWIARQAKKIPAALDELEKLLGANDSFTPHGFGLAEIAAGCALGYLDLRYPELDWRAGRSGLARLQKRLAERPSFAATPPQAQPIAIS